MLTQDHAIRLSLSPGVTPQEVLRSLVAQGIAVEKFEVAIPTLDEIFIRVVTGEGGEKSNG
jgi:ABC-2 type transport system ATP-binding protein